MTPDEADLAMLDEEIARVRKLVEQRKPRVGHHRMRLLDLEQTRNMVLHAKAMAAAGHTYPKGGGA